jgi:hypothetical protein
MKILYTWVVALVLPIAGATMGLTSTSPCGQPDDSCMDNENWKQCRNLELNGCQHIQVLEQSCPLQFTCGDDDDDDDDDERLHQDEEDGMAFSRIALVKDEIDGVGVDEKPSACVRLYVYNDDKCRGPAIRVNSFATWIHSGSACYHDATMHHYSVRDQYCDPRTMNYHETVIVGSTTCHQPPWWKGGKKYDFTFTTDSCIEGISLKGCFKGPCDDSDEMDMDDIRIGHSGALAKL